ncbi:RNA polymerase sigma factor [uncultured Sporomusa sp.]|nr:RNA polymerase sigma factor [uncultured Sporomusa sp.]
MPSSFSDPAFIECLKQKDEEAWGQFYLAIAPKMKGFICVKLSSYRNHWDVNATADDITQAAFEKALKRIQSYNSKKSALGTWMFNIANNTFIDLTRKLESERNFMKRCLKNFMDNEEQTVATVEELCKNMKISHESLTERQKAYIDMFYIQQWSDELIAEKMEVSTNAVVKARGRLLSQLRDLLEESRSEVS